MPLWKVPLQLSCRPSPGTGRLQSGLPRTFSSAGWTASILSAWPHSRGTPSLWPAPTAPCLSCAGGSRAGCRTPGGVSREQSRGAESPPLTCWPRCFWCSPGYGWPSGLQLPQSLLIGQALQPFDHLHDLHLDPLQSVHIFFELWGPELDTVVQVWPDKGWAEWDDDVSVSAHNAPADAAQGLICRPCCSDAPLTPANVTPIYRKGRKEDPGNYRPVSLTSVPGKIMEWFILSAHTGHVQENRGIRPSQHGFMKGRSCFTSLISFYDQVTCLVDEGKAEDVVYDSGTPAQPVVQQHPQVPFSKAAPLPHRS